jgi:hypothetical protein
MNRHDECGGEWKLRGLLRGHPEILESVASSVCLELAQWDGKRDRSGVHGDACAKCNGR